MRISEILRGAWSIDLMSSSEYADVSAFFAALTPPDDATAFCHRHIPRRIVQMETVDMNDFTLPPDWSNISGAMMREPQFDKWPPERLVPAQRRSAKLGLDIGETCFRRQDHREAPRQLERRRIDLTHSLQNRLDGWMSSLVG